MEYFLFFIWITIMLSLFFRVMAAHKALQNVLKKRQFK